MNQRIFTLISFLFLIHYFGFSQINHVNVEIKTPSRLIYGDNYYSSNFKGISDFVIDLKTMDADAFMQMNPMFLELEKKRIKYRMAGATATALGGGMMVLGSIKALHSFNEVSTENPDFINSAAAGLGFVIGGGLLSTFGTLVFFSGELSERDINRFINKHNSINKHKKLKWEVGFLSHRTKGTGMTLGFKF